MTKYPKEDGLYVVHMLEHIATMQRFMADGMQDEKTFFAVIRCFEVIGEAAAHLSPEYREKHPEIAWKEIIGMRNVLIHDYLGVNPKTVWECARDDIPELKRQLELLIEKQK